MEMSNFAYSFIFYFALLQTAQTVQCTMKG